MALSPTDFYAYSRATGTPYPESPEERAQIAPQVLDFRRNQLTAPSQPQSQGVDPLSMGVGIGLGLAGLGAGAYGIRRMLGRGKQVPKSTSRSANAGVRQVDLSRDIEQAVARGRESTVPPSQAPDLVDIQQQSTAPVMKQQQIAVDSGINQEVSRMTRKVQRNEDVDISNTAAFLAAQRDEIASQLGEQGLTPSPSRIEQELANRMGPGGWEYGPEFTKQKHTMELGLTDPSFLSDPDKQTISLAGNDFELNVADLMSDDPGTAFKRPFINQDTAVAAEARYQNDQNSIKDWLGDKRLEAQQDVVRINNERSALKQRMNQLREEENILQYSMAQSPGSRMRSAGRLDEVQAELESLVDRWDQGEQQLSRINNRIAGAQNFAQNALEDVSKTLPTTLVDWSGEGFVVQPKGLTTSTFVDEKGRTFDVVQGAANVAELGPEDLEVVSGRRKAINNLEPDEEGNLIQAASQTSIRGRSGVPFSSEAKEQPMGARAREAASQTAYIQGLRPTSIEESSTPKKKWMSEFNQEEGSTKVQSRGVRTTASPRQGLTGGVGIYGIEATGYPASAVTKEGEYTYEATQRPTRTKGIISQSPQDVLVIDESSGQRKAARRPGRLEQSPLLDLSDDQLNEMVLMGNAAGGEAEMIGMEAERVLRYRNEASALERQQQALSSVRMSEAVRAGTIKMPPRQGPAESPGGKAYPQSYLTERPEVKPATAPSVVQGQLPSDVVPATAFAARVRKTPADIAADQLESYMAKLQRGRSTPLTSEVVIQPRLF